ncbi:hypothetical protein VTP01DRAFT_3055 [Rhizomucor pusillus]|uniref:uncharacterized protein n=1 Tax=Rhizomucor pusillus TaxID=4840 RepID=UPI0037430744
MATHGIQQSGNSSTSWTRSYYQQRRLYPSPLTEQNLSYHLSTQRSCTSDFRYKRVAEYAYSQSHIVSSASSSQNLSPNTASNQNNLFRNIVRR